jgi:hypothetical protein
VTVSEDNEISPVVRFPNFGAFRRGTPVMRRPKSGPAVVLVRRPSPQRIIYTSVAIPAHHPGARIAATAARRG